MILLFFVNLAKNLAAQIWSRFRESRAHLKVSEATKFRAKAGPTGIEPATYGLRVRRSGLTELRAHSASLLKSFIE
jgi:hypothetical protein